MKPLRILFLISADDEQVYDGPVVVEVPAPLERLHYYVRD
jgi:hypothetical protein